MTTVELYNAIVEKRGQFCEMCGARVGTELHHCLYHRRKGAAFYDVPENLELLCKQCHSTGFVNSWKHRVEFWIKQCSVYGSQHMEEWNNNLPIKIKQKFV